MKPLKIFSYILIVLLAYACNKAIELKLPDYTSKIVINGEANTDTVFSVQVSRSLPIMQENDSTGYLLMNATVRVIEAGTFIGNAVYQGGYYVLNKRPKPNTSYSIEASAPGFSTARAQFTVPKAINITTSYIDSIGLDNEGFKVGQITLSFTDEPLVKNYYRLLIRYYNVGTWSPFNFISNDIVFLNNQKLNDGSYVFSDRTFSGKSKVLLFSVPEGLATSTPKFEISIKSFPEDYYNYLLQTNTYNQNGNGISNDPIILRSNVSNGLGMVGPVSNARDTIQ
jgi:hypothetical protein